MGKGEEEIKMKGSTHNHSTGSDGKLTPEQLIKKAIELGWDYVYFTDHYFLPKEIHSDYHKGFFSKGYIKEVKKLKEKYKDKIEICFGVEFDWFDGYKNWIKKEIKKQDYEYIIGSIHKIPSRKGYLEIEPGREKWIKNAEVFGGIKEYVQEYYKQIKNLVNSGLFDSVGHLDYIKVYNKKQDLFKEDLDWYKKEVLETLDLIKQHKMALEINHGGIRKHGEQFPSTWVLKEARKRNIPITLGIDSHWQEHFDNKIIKELIDIAKHAGYNSVVRFKNRKMIKEKL